MIFIGFAVLMFGMETMSGAVKPLADVPEFANVLTMFSNPVLGLIAGAVLTAVIQSSSASVLVLRPVLRRAAVAHGERGQLFQKPGKRQKHKRRRNIKRYAFQEGQQRDEHPSALHRGF